MTGILEAAGLSAVELTMTMAVVLIAGIVRGFSGFGMSAIIVLALSMIMAPSQVVPVAMLLEIVASLRMLPGTWRDVNWRLAGWLLAGSAVGTPIGAWLLLHLPVPVMRLVLSVFVLCVCLVLWRGFRLKTHPGAHWGLAVGVFSGTANGAASFGGQPNALFLLSAPIAAASVRATLIFIALVTDIYGSTVYRMNGLLTTEVLWKVGLFLIPMVLGIAIGQRGFSTSRPETYRRIAILLLTSLAVAGLIRTLLG
ncbi:MAG: sulfite exporter TauE/SafE family protein [Rhodospirillales bacterium]|nr:sulfite exporter TauE/SafE family protein [Rhodospirillales bacterium]